MAEKKGGAAGPDGQVPVAFNLNKDRVDVIKRAFPERPDVEELAKQIAEFMTGEFVDLLAGKKRYLSLSHQYIEWVQLLCEIVLPGEECTYSRLYDRFNFPPGTASYIARVLRDRQNTPLHLKARDGLQTKVAREVEKYEKIPDKEKPTHKRISLKLTLREYNVLMILVDRLMSKDEVIEYPQITSRGREFINITFNVDYLKLVLPLIANS